MADEGRTEQEEGGADAAGTNRDYDESQESKNQGHGHPRDRQGGGEAGHSERRITEADRQERDLGGPGG